MQTPVLSESDIEHFITRGYVRVRGCFSREMGLIAKSGRALRQYESFLDYHFGRHAARVS